MLSNPATHSFAAGAQAKLISYLCHVTFSSQAPASHVSESPKQTTHMDRPASAVGQSETSQQPPSNRSALYVGYQSTFTHVMFTCSLFSSSCVWNSVYLVITPALWVDFPCLLSRFLLSLLLLTHHLLQTTCLCLSCILTG